NLGRGRSVVGSGEGTRVVERSTTCKVPGGETSTTAGAFIGHAHRRAECFETRNPDFRLGDLLQRSAFPDDGTAGATGSGNRAAAADAANPEGGNGRPGQESGAARPPSRLTLSKTQHVILLGSLTRSLSAGFRGDPHPP